MQRFAHHHADLVRRGVANLRVANRDARIDDQLAPLKAPVGERREPGFDIAVARGQFFAEHQRVFNRDPCAACQMRRGGMGGIADQQDASLVPGRRLKRAFQRAVDDGCLRCHRVTNGCQIAAEISQQPAHGFGEILRLDPSPVRIDVEHEDIALVGRTRRYPCQIAVAEIDFAPIKIGWPVTQDAPARLAGEARLDGCWEQHFADFGIYAVGADHKIIAPRAAVAEAHIDTDGVAVERVHRQAQPDAHTQFAHAGRHDRVEIRPQNPAGCGQPIFDQRLIHLLNERAREMEQFCAVGDRAHCLDLIEQAKPLIGAQGGASDGNACAVNPPFRVKINQVNRNACFCKLDRRCHPADAAADDQNFFDALQIRSPHSR